MRRSTVLRFPVQLVFPVLSVVTSSKLRRGWWPKFRWKVREFRRWPISCRKCWFRHKNLFSSSLTPPTNKLECLSLANIYSRSQDTQHNKIQHVDTQLTECQLCLMCYGKCHHAECCYAECRYADCHGAFSVKSNIFEWGLLPGVDLTKKLCCKFSFYFWKDRSF